MIFAASVVVFVMGLVGLSMMFIIDWKMATGILFVMYADKYFRLIIKRL